jgi:hypothetical protein
MRDRARQRALAGAKSRRATREELRDAGKRLKELQVELQHIELLPETKHGEERQQRYQRLLRIRSMREDFQGDRPLEETNAPKSLMLAGVMVVATILLVVSCVGGGIAALAFVNQKPDPLATASQFWSDMVAQKYVDIHTNLLSPTLRVHYDENTFVTLADQADTDFGAVSNAVQTRQSGDMQQTANLVYAVTRGPHTYNVTLTLVLHANSWGIDNLGAAIDPTLAGLPAPKATPTPVTPAATGSPTDTPTGDISRPPSAA